MRKRLGCLHAHYSNIGYIDEAFSAYDIELIHFTDPGLMHRVTSDEKFQEADAQNRVNEQIEWIAQCDVDAILITCTNYIAVLKEDQLSISVPIIKIDEPFFAFISNIEQPQKILFTNPATIQGTIDRLKQYADYHQKSLDLEVAVIGNSFDLIMRGLKGKYNQKIYKYLDQAVKEENKIISIAQLSMVDAAKQVEEKTSKTIINPMNTLVPFIVNHLVLEKNE
ncbi:hypothetical protein MKY30_07500 [Oceanobacillus sp. FSL W8-0428]|uniref:hypothetical protein n=1 Tax=Oceanobacillus TaxID=182709 RepID=UPI0030D6D162